MKAGVHLSLRHLLLGHLYFEYYRTAKRTILNFMQQGLEATI